MLLVGEPVARLVRAVVLGRGAVAVQVEARAEAAARAREDRRAARALAGEREELIVQRLAQLGSHRVELLGAVERQPADVLGRLVYEQHA